MGRMYKAGLYAAVIIAGLTGCSAAGPGDVTEEWQSPLNRDHPLAGKIWNPGEGRFARPGELRDALRDAHFLLIGEKHDNRDHHRFQARLIGWAAEEDRRPAVVFEMLNAEQQKALDFHLQASPGDAAGIGAAVGWEKHGWPDWADYQPIAEEALSAEMPLLAGAIQREATRRISREGLSALGRERVTTLMLEQPLDESLRADMRMVIHESHCGQLPKSMLDPMVAVTLAKDAVMADAMIAARGGGGRDMSILIAGAGHARMDWGVPLHLRRRLPDSRIISIGIMEVDGQATDPAAYAESYGGQFPFDFIWFTPRVDDDDPCEVFARQLQKMREKRSSNSSDNGG